MNAISFSGPCGFQVASALISAAMNEAAVFAAQQVLKKNAQGKRQRGQVAHALFFEGLQAMNIESLRANAEPVARLERIACGDGHPRRPFWSVTNFL